MTVNTIPIAGLSLNDPVPGIYSQINFAQGQSPNSSATNKILIIGNKLSSGTAALNTVYGVDTVTPMTNVSDCKALFGSGVNTSLMYADLARTYEQAAIYAIVAAESSGNKATGTITISTGNAAAPGTLRINIAHWRVDVGIGIGDDQTAIAANAVTAISANPDLPVTATSALGVITLTFKLKGLQGNWCRISGIIYGTGVGLTVTPTTQTNMTGGTVADSYTSVLSAIAPNEYWMIVSADDGGQGSTNLSALVSQVDSQAQPLIGILQRVFFGSTDSLANTITIATGLNSARASCIWQYQGDMLPCVLAANYAGIYGNKMHNFSNRSFNFNDYGNAAGTETNWYVPFPLTGNGITRAQKVSALTNGISPVATNSSRKTSLVAAVTTRSQTNGNPDPRIRAIHKVEVTDRFVRNCATDINFELTGKVIGDDPRPGENPIEGVATPRNLKDILFRNINFYGSQAILQRIDTTKSSVITLRETANPSRLSGQVDLCPVDILDQVAVLYNQVSAV